MKHRGRHRANDDMMDEMGECIIPVDVDEDYGVIYVFSEIDDNTALTITKSLQRFSSDDKIDIITMYINSPGGSASSAMSICDSMLTCRKPIRTIGTGKVMSAAIPILACGTKDHRFLHKHTFGMIHQPYIENNQAITTEDSKSLSYAMDLLYEYLLELSSRYSTKKQKSLLDNALQKNSDQYLTSEQMVDMGIADHIL